MRTNPFFFITLFSLTALGGWGIWEITSSNTPEGDAPKRSIKKISSTPQQNNHTQSKKPEEVDPFNSDVTHIKALLNRNEFTQAVEYLNERYSDLNNEQLETLKTLFINTGLLYSDENKPRKAQRLYIASSALFEGVEILDLLSNVSIELEDWQTALDALLKSSLIESRSDVINNKLITLANIAGQLKRGFEASSDFESARKLYQPLYDAHPSHAQFQIELAFIKLKLGDTSSARQLFNEAQYDLNLGHIAKQQLALLDAQDANKIEPKAVEPQRKVNNDINISLARAGNSFLADTLINGRKTRLLLDTGASITSLSSETISQLGLSPTGDVIRLSTANGVTESRLFSVKKINLGRIVIRDLVVAEISLGSSQHFQGLLGTDLLNKVGTKYSYLIDNENNTLIFRPKSR